MTERHPREPPAATASDASQARTVAPDQPAVSGEPKVAPLLQPGQRFGSYAIARLLGRGGMGEVYEAEEVDSGRRVALKLLNRPLSTREERDRFLREGRLAAGVSHPHCVYVFGTDEIDGLPVISMELAAGGTLKDTVAARGPLPSRKAVDAILQVIDGLEAAAAAGVLHRDIKPANCFVDVEGRVKVGDFGLSTSTLASEETHLTMAGTIMGTPAFASPEQMRADNLDIRSDIYSVGATLYYLLTGRAPFEESNIVRLVTMVMQDVPPAPSELRRDIPKGLSAAVLRALAKRPGDRFDDYAAMRAALEPFSSTAPVPAPVGLRVVAYLVDYLLIGILSVLFISPFAVFKTRISTDLGTVISGGGFTPAQVLVPLLAWAIYWLLFEGLTGASLGKRLFRLRVAGVGGEPAGFGRVLLRTTVFLVMPSAMALGWFVPAIRDLYTGNAWLQSKPEGQSMWVIPLLILFASARRRNGFAGLHELASRTRVIAARTVERADRVERMAAEPPAVGSRRIGPYSLADDAARAADAKILPGWDVALRRPVWLHRVPHGYALPAWRRDLARSARPRWLAGRREEGESWDAYEAVDGRPFLAAVETPQPWRTVRVWLGDLARELEAGLRDGSLPALELDRLWVANDGRITLLDWPAPGAERHGESDGPAGTADPADPIGRPDIDRSAAARFLHLVATAALGAEAVLPLPARRLLDDLSAGWTGTRPNLDVAVASAASGPAEVTRGLRALHLAFQGTPPIGLVLLAWLMTVVLIPQVFSTNAPTAIAYVRELEQLARLEAQPDAPGTRALREAFEIDIAARFPEFLSTGGTSSPVQTSLPSELQALAVRIRTKHPHPTADAASRAREMVAPLLARPPDERQRVESQVLAVLPRAAQILWALFGAMALVLAIGARGGAVMALLGIAVVDASGRPAARWRCAARAFAAWLPIFGGVAVGVWGGPAFVNGSIGGSVAVFFAGGAYAVARPTRGLQDRIAGTWLVPR